MGHRVEPKTVAELKNHEWKLHYSLILLTGLLLILVLVLVLPPLATRRSNDAVYHHEGNQTVEGDHPTSVAHVNQLLNATSAEEVSSGNSSHATSHNHTGTH